MTFQSFDSFDEMFEAMGRAEEAANARVRPWQQAIGLTEANRWWFRVDTIGELGCAVFGECWTEPQIIQVEQDYYDDLTDPEQAAEFEAVRRSIADRYQRGYRTGQAYSEVCPEGEGGDTHVSVMFPMTKAAFEAARVAEWDLWRWVQLLAATYEPTKTKE